MSISEYKPRSEYVGTGAISIYTFDFKVIDAVDIEVAVYNAAYVQQYKVRGDDGSRISAVSINATEGGQITLVAALPSGYHLVISQAKTEPIQPKVFTNSRTWTLAQLERALDYLAYELQSIANQSNRSLKLAVSQLDTDLVDVEIPRIVADAVLVGTSDAKGFTFVSKSLFKGDKGDTGDTGPAGPTGPGGAAGPQGPAGTNSLGIHTAAVNPTAGDGVNGDFWINTVTGDYFQKAAGAWTLKGNLIGPQGPVGPQGIQGPQGDPGLDGDTIYTEEGDPNNFGGPGIIFPGNEGDLFIDITAGGASSYYQMKSGTWDLRGQLQGLQGPPGPAGPPGGVADLEGQMGSLFFEDLKYFADVTDIGNGVSQIACAFSSAMVDTDYNVTFGFENMTDADPIALIGWITAKTMAGFTVKFNAPTDSINYKLNWQARRNQV